MATTQREREGEGEKGEALRLKGMEEAKFESSKNVKPVLKYAKRAKRMASDLEGISDERNTFWTACSTCRLLHQFERRYLGHKLVCPSCNKSFKAVEEVQNHGSQKEEVRVRGRSECERLELKKKVCMGVDGNGSETLGSFVLRKKMGGVVKSSGVKGKVGGEKGGNFTRRSNEVGKGGLEKEGDDGRLRKRMRTVGEVLERSKPKRIITGEEMMTLAEFQSEVKRKAQQKKVKMKKKEEERTEKLTF